MFSNVVNVLRVKPQFLLSCGGDSVIRVWNLCTGTLLLEMDDHYHLESIVAVSTNWEINHYHLLVGVVGVGGGGVEDRIEATIQSLF